MAIPNKVQLITYPDSLGGNLSSLYTLLVKRFPDLFAGVHILPPFPSSGDRGFSPLTYFEIDPRFGSWEDIHRLSQRFDILVDIMVNHISRRSAYFQDFEKRGKQSPFADLFIPLEKVWPGGNPDPEDVAKIFLRKPDNPFSEVPIQATGESIRVWTTFGSRTWSEQIDVDVHSSAAHKLFREILAHFGQNGVKMVRLDAVGYVIKKPGTSCFFVEPDIYDFLEWISQLAAANGIQVLPEVHASAAIQKRLAAHSVWVYNFALPLLVLHTLLAHDSRALRQHLNACPSNQFTMLDCHDGIPVQPDIEGLLTVDQAQRVVDICIERGANLSRLLSSSQPGRRPFDAHQINIAYFSALGANENAVLAARAIQFFTPGVPQVYYLGLLAGENDLESVAQTGEGRAINRRNYTTDEVEQALQMPVVQRLIRLIRFRNEYPAFQGNFQVLDSSEQELHLAWSKGEHACHLLVDLISSSAVIAYNDPDGNRIEFNP